MTLTLPPQLESFLIEQARRQGVEPETLAVNVLSRHLLAHSPLSPADEWETKLFEAAVDGGRSVPDSALSSNGLYE